MKKFFSLVVAALFISSSAFAAKFTKNITASATFAGEATITFDLYNVSDDSTATALNWTSAEAFNMGSTTKWVAADQYAKVVANITKANASVRMYTDNKTGNSSLQPNYTEWNGNQGVVGTESYGGLVRAGGNGGAYRGYVPVLFSYVSTKTQPTLNVNTTTGVVTETVTNDQSDRYLSDISNGGYDANYTVIASLNGPTFFTKDNNVDVQYPSSTVQNGTAYMYFFGGFKDIIGGDTYSTTIKVESSWE